jgi:hypothetical protein
VIANTVRALRLKVIASSASLGQTSCYHPVFLAWPCPGPAAISLHAPRPASSRLGACC